MLRYSKKFIVLIYTLLLVFAAGAYADEEVEDLIDIYESNSKIIAIAEGKRRFVADLGLKERVLWSDSRGYLGAFLTNERFFVISTTSGGWQVMPLRLDESEKGGGVLSPYIGLLVTGNRAVGFDAASDRFIETKLPIHDALLATQVEKYVAVVITSSRAFGLASNASSFAEIRFRVRETMETVKLTSSKATVRTSDRLLTFESRGATWNAYNLH